MDFKKFNGKLQNQFNDMQKTGKLFRVGISGDMIWDLYLSSFKPEDNKIFRDPESSEHNCNCCKNFIRRYGNIVSINKVGELESIFSNVGDVGEYTLSANACDMLIRDSQIKDVFFETFNELDKNLNYESCKKNQPTYKLGIASNYKQYTQDEVNKFGVVNTEKVYEFNHFNLDLLNKFVDFSGKSIEAIMAHYRDKYSVFKRAMEEISLDTLNLVKDLINQGSLLDGTAHLHTINAVILHKSGYEETKLQYPHQNMDIVLWNSTYELDERICKFKNTAIGTLCSDLAEGMELNKACEKWNKMVDPVNYHKATAPITQRQINEAKKFVVENGYVESFNRKIATIDDIKASEILHMNSGDGKIEEVSIFDSVKPTSTRHKKAEFEKLEEVSIEKFMKDILPSCTSVEAYLENRMEGNLVVMTTAINSDSKNITKWNGIASNYSWTFNGNLAGKSQIKQAVKDAGGNVEGVLNFRLAWNGSDTNGNDGSDLDAWAKEPNGTKIGYSSGFRKDRGNKRTTCSGQLDVDNTNPNGKLAVENITWTDLNKMKEGKYLLWVNQFSPSRSQGFKSEIEFDGEIYTYEYNKAVSGNVKVATVTLKNGKFTIEHHLDAKSDTITKDLWNLKTNDFHKVNLVCKSPNHWGDNKAGNLHYFFMLDKCKTNDKVRSFHNENLTEDLLKHRKVMEVLGTTTMLEPTDKQLAGVGFNSTVKDELIVKCKGTFNRMLKIKFK